VHKFLLFLLPFLFLGCSTEHNAINSIPLADAGNNQSVIVGTTVTLDGSASYDANADQLTFSWKFVDKPADSTTILINKSAAYPHFTADVVGDYILELSVNDGQVESKSDFVSIHAYTSIDPSTGEQMPNELFTAAQFSTTYRPMILIRIEFKDYKFNRNNDSTQDIWYNKVFGVSKGDLNHYYNEISLGQVQFEPVNNGPVSQGVYTITLDQDHPDFYSGSSLSEWQNDITSRLHPILADALRTLSDDGFDFNVYDNVTVDGKITPDELLLTFILAGQEDAYTAQAIESGVWAHVDCTSGDNVVNVNGVTLLGCSSQGNYAVFGERHEDSSSNHTATIGIIAHELGHSAFDLPDLYYGSATRIGYYGLMSNGSWGQIPSNDKPGSSPVHMTAWSKIDVGWFTKISEHNDSNSLITLNATGESDYNILKTPSFNSNDEYFLVENRGNSSYDEGLKAVNPNYNGGVAIWHIDAKIIADKRINNTVNESSSHKGVDLEEAAGALVDYGNGDSVLNLYYSENVNTFTPNTDPNTNLYTGELSYIFITDISSQSNHMTLKVNNPKEAP